MIERNGAVSLVLVISYKYFLIPLWGPMVIGFTHLQPTGAVGSLLPCSSTQGLVGDPVFKSFNRVCPGPSHRSAVLCVCQ